MAAQPPSQEHGGGGAAANSNDPHPERAAAATADVEGLAHYAALGFDATALERLRRAGCDPAARLRVVSARDVRAAWLRAARRWHPDKQRGGDDDAAAATAAAAFVRARLAYGVLGDARSRRAYDLLGAEAGLAAARAADGKAGGGGGGGNDGGGSARGAAGAVPVTVWYGDEEGDDVAAGAAAYAQEAALCVEDMVRRLMLEQEEKEQDGAGPGVAAAAPPPATPLATLDPSRQLALLCELCPRPSSRTCWTCGASLCAFCSRRPHYALHGAPVLGSSSSSSSSKNGNGNGCRRRRRPKPPGLVPAHYPLIDAPGSMAETLGRQEWEQKRLEDARAAIRRAPGYRPEAEGRALRAFLEDEGEEEDGGGDKRRRSSGRYYRWCVVASRGNEGGFVHEARVAVFLPTGGGGEGEGPEARVELEGGGGGGSGGPLFLSVFSAGAPKKVIDRRRLALPVVSWAGVEARTVAGGRAVVVRLPLGISGEASSSWRLFEGDEPGARRRWQPADGDGGGGNNGRRLYSLVDEAEEDESGGGVRVVFEDLLPWWVDAREDVEVDCFFRGGGGGEGAGAAEEEEGGGGRRQRLALRVKVAGVLELRRTYSREAAAALSDESRSAWWCDGGDKGDGASRARPARTLSVSVPLRPPTADERAFKGGARQDPRAAVGRRHESPLAPWLPPVRHGGGRGVAFFEEDEDEFGLDALLEAMEGEEKEEHEDE